MTGAQSHEPQPKRRGPPPIPPPTDELPRIETAGAPPETGFEAPRTPETLVREAEERAAEEEAQAAAHEQRVETYAAEAGEPVPTEASASFAQVRSAPRRLFRRFLSRLGFGKEQSPMSAQTEDAAWVGSEIGPVPAEAREPAYTMTPEPDPFLEAESGDPAIRRFFETPPGAIEAALEAKIFSDVREAPLVEEAIDQSLAVTQVLALNATARGEMIAELIQNKDADALKDVMNALMAQYEYELQIRIATAQTEDEKRWAKKAKGGKSVPKGAPAELDLLLRDIRRVGEATHLLKTQKRETEPPLQAREIRTEPEEVLLGTEEAEAINKALAGVEAPTARIETQRFPEIIALEERTAALMQAEPTSLEERETLANTPAVPAVELPFSSELKMLREKATVRVEQRLAELAKATTEAEQAERALLLDQKRELSVGLIPLDMVRSRIATLRVQKNRIDHILTEADAGKKQLTPDQETALLRRVIQHDAELIALAIYLTEPYAKTLETTTSAPLGTEAVTTEVKAVRAGKQRKLAAALNHAAESEEPTPELSPKLRALDAQIAGITQRLRDEATSLPVAEQTKLVWYLYQLKGERYEALDLYSPTAKTKVAKAIRKADMEREKTVGETDTKTKITQVARAVYNASPTIPEAVAWGKTAEKEYEDAKKKHIARAAEYLSLLRKPQLTVDERGLLDTLQAAVSSLGSKNFFVRYRAHLNGEERNAIAAEIGSRVVALGAAEKTLFAAMLEEEQKRSYEKAKTQHIEDTALKIALRAEEQERGALSAKDQATLKRLAARPPFLYRFLAFLSLKEREAISEAIFLRAAALRNSRKQELADAAE